MHVNGSKENDTECREWYVFKPLCFRECAWSSEEHRPKPRSGHRVVCDKRGNLFCYGGYNPNQSCSPEDLDWNDSQPLFRELWKFNFASSRWKRLNVTNIPNELVSCALIHFRDCIIEFGGTGYPFGAISSNSVAVCDLRSRPLDFKLLKVEGNLPSPQYGQGCVLDESTFYTVGGTNGYDYSSDIHKLNLETGEWELVYACKGQGNEPFGRYRHELAYDGEQIFLLGGGTVDLNANLEHLPVFNISLKRWDVVKTSPDPSVQRGYPNPRKYHSCVQLPGQLKFLIIGGYDGNDVLNDCWLLDLNNFQWKFLPSMNLPLATYFHSSAVTPAGKLYTFGGVYHRSKTPERTSIMYSAWLGIPSLKEMCWDAVKHYQFTKYFSKSELRSVGIPIEYINEIE